MTQLAHKFFKSSEVVRNAWSITPEHGTPPEALLDPRYWAHVSAQMRRGDIVTALPEDNSYFAEFIVLDVGKLFAKVYPIRIVQIQTVGMLNIKVPDGYEIKFRGPKKWSVLRQDDKGVVVLKDGMEKQDAERWLEDHLKAFNKAA